MKVKKVRSITYITFIRVGSNEFEEYVGESFEAVLTNGVINHFKDWMNGSIRSTSDIGEYESGKGFDMEMFTDSYTDTLLEKVTHTLIQKLHLHLGELSYPYEETADIGIPYLRKRSQEEMDLILLDEIYSTDGVSNVTNFESKVEDRVYKVNFEVEVTGGAKQWISTEV